jgi:hypothetical protein
VADFFEELTARLTADISGFKAGMVGAVADAKAAERGIGVHMASIGQSLMNVTRLTVLFGAAIAATGVAIGTVLVKQSLDAIDKLAKLSDQTGISTEALAGLKLQAELNGIEFETLTGGIVKMNRGLAEAVKGTGPANEAFKKLGLNISQLQSMKPDEAFGLVGDAIAKLGTHSERTAAAMDIFGRGGARLLGTLMQGTAGIKGYRKEVEDFGSALSRIEAGKIEAANDEFTRMKSAVKGVSDQLTLALSPFLLKAATDINEMTKNSGGFKDAIASAINVVITVVGYLADAWDVVKIVMQTVVVASASIGVSFWETINAVVKAILYAKTILANFGNLVKEEFVLVGDTIKFAFAKTGETINGLIGTAKNALANLMSSLGEHLTSIGSSLGETVTKSADAMRREATAGAKDAADEVAAASADMEQSAGNVALAWENILPTEADLDTGALQDIANEATTIFEASRAKLDAMWEAPLSSEGIKKWAADAIAEAQRVGEAIAAASLLGTNENAEFKEKQARAEKWLDQHRANLDQELLFENEAYQREVEQAKANFALTMATEQEQNAILEEMKQDHETSIALIEQRSAEEKKKTQKEAQDWAVGYAMSYMGRMASVMDQGSRKQFAIAKALRMGQAIVDTASAAVTGYNNGMTAGGPYYGPVLGAAYAAAAIAFGAVQIATIASSSYGGGGSPTAGSAAVPSASTGSPPGGSAGVSGQAERGQAIQWNISGSVFGPETIRDMARQLDSFISDGGRIGSIRTN